MAAAMDNYCAAARPQPRPGKYYQPLDASTCAYACGACQGGDTWACSRLGVSPPCARACAQAAEESLFSDPLASTLESFVGDREYWQGGEASGAPADENPGGDRDERAVRAASFRGSSLQAATPQFMNREDMWGGGLRRMLAEDTIPRREDEFWYAPNYVPIGFARYQSPIVDPADYNYYQMAGWRVAIPRDVPSPERHDLLRRIYAYGPQAAGYARLGDAIVPAILGPGDRQTLAETESRYGPIALKYPYSL